jgi:hypothetical protein
MTTMTATLPAPPLDLLGDLVEYQRFVDSLGTADPWEDANLWEANWLVPVASGGLTLNRCKLVFEHTAEVCANGREYILSPGEVTLTTQSMLRHDSLAHYLSLFQMNPQAALQGVPSSTTWQSRTSSHLFDPEQMFGIDDPVIIHGVDGLPRVADGNHRVVSALRLGLPLKVWLVG